MTSLAWKPRRWVWGLWAGLPCIAMLASSLIGTDQTAFAEGGLIERCQASLWAVSIFAAAFVYVSVSEPRERCSALLLGSLALGALLREWDAHTALNPENLGSLGVRYRLDWWLDASVSLPLKLAWSAAFGTVGTIFVVLVLRSRGPIHWRHARPRFLLAAVGMVIVGFAMDDISRGMPGAEIRVVVEESAELVAAMCFLCATLAPE